MTAPWVELDEDWHVHSTFSDGTSTVEENIAEALALGLRRLVLVDHVRADTAWIAEFVEAAAAARRGAGGLEVACGVEATLLDTSGALDMPRRLPSGVRIFAADHQVPTPGGPGHPREIRAALEQERLGPAQVVGWIMQSTIGAVARHPGLVVAHLFSILPKIGLSEADVADAELAVLAATAARQGAIVEISERWRCPGPRALAAMRSAGVRVVASTDSHRRDAIGRYAYVPEAARAALDGEEHRPPGRK
jgi:putative hydrolase